MVDLRQPLNFYLFFSPFWFSETGSGCVAQAGLHLMAILLPESWNYILTQLFKGECWGSGECGGVIRGGFLCVTCLS